eukprot:243946-Chlamydomonas_euryale.AAC.1
MEGFMCVPCHMEGYLCVQTYCIDKAPRRCERLPTTAASPLGPHNPGQEGGDAQASQAVKKACTSSDRIHHNWVVCTVSGGYRPLCKLAVICHQPSFRDCQ